MARLDNKRAIITGAAGGIGAECAKLFCSEGASVTLVDRNAEALFATEQAIIAEIPNANIQACVADIANLQRTAEVIQQAITSYGGLDILVNNAAMRNYSNLSEATPKEWLEMIEVNLIGAANYCREALPYLRQSRSASIVNVASCYALVGRKGMGIYDTTKAGYLAFTRTLAHEEAKYGIRVNSISPGSTLTDYHVLRAAANKKDIKQLENDRQETSLLRRWATTQEIAWPILWLASNEASFITGTNLVVDGGLTAM